MKKLSIKMYVMGLIILLLGAPIISTTSVLSAGNQASVTTTAIDSKIASVLEMINESMLREYLEDLVAIGPKVTGTYGCEKAAEYLYHQFEGMNLETRCHDWTLRGNQRIPRLYRSQNVEATQEGTDDSYEELLIFNAHYDTVKVSPGANDDGSGVVAVLAAAYVLSQFDFRRTIKYVLFSGEENGLLGSKVYARELYDNGEEVLVELNADMIGHTKTAEGGRRYRMYGTKDISWIMDDIEMINEVYNISFNFTRGTIGTGGRGGSDYFSFVQYGFESIAFFQAETWVEYFHTPEDTIEHVNFSYLVNTTRIIVGTLAHLADADDIHPQIKIASPKRGRLYFEDRILRNFKNEGTKVFDDVLICSEVKAGDAPINRVEFYYDGKLVYNDTETPFQWRLNKLSMRKHKIEVMVYDELGRTASDEIGIFYLNLIKKR